MCKICENELAMDVIKDATKYMGEVRFCPMCGEPIGKFTTFMDWFKNIVARLNLSPLKNVIYDENGKPMMLDRKPSIPKQPDIHRPTKPRDMTFDLDKIDITKELEMLAEYERHNKAANTMNAVGAFFSQPKVAINPIVLELFKQFCEEQEDLEDDGEL